MNKKIPLAVLVGVVVVAAAAAFGYSAGVAAVKEQFGVKGWVQVKVVRDGQVIYYHEGHNVITNLGKYFIASQVGSGQSAQNNGTRYIGLSATNAYNPNNYGAEALDWAKLPDEITGGGLARALGTYSYDSQQKRYTVQKTFQATDTHTGVWLAGLYSGDGDSLFAAHHFDAVNLISGDQLTVTWTITIS